MKILIIFLAGVAFGFWLGRNRKELRSKNYELSAGQKEKEERKEEIMQMFAEKAPKNGEDAISGLTEVKNDDVQKMLGVSDATATNYLSELEAEGKVEQVGTVGRFVKYRRIYLQQKEPADFP